VTIPMSDASRERRSSRSRMGERTGMTGSTNGTGMSTSGSRSTNGSRGDTTGDSDSSMSARGGDTTFVPFGIVDDVIALTGAFQYGTAIIIDCILGICIYTCLFTQGEELFCFVLMLWRMESPAIMKYARVTWVTATNVASVLVLR